MSATSFDFDGYHYELVNQFSYDANHIDDIGGPGYDSGWIGTGTQVKVIVGTTIISPCSSTCPPSPPPV